MFRSKRNKLANMQYLGYQRLGTVPILAANGGYQFGPANRTYSELGHYNWRAHVPDIRSGPATQCTRGLPPVVRKSMVADGTHQAKLAENRNYLPTWEDESVGIHTTTRVDK